MIKFDNLENETKLVDIYGELQISWKDASFTDEVQFRRKCHGHEIVN